MPTHCRVLTKPLIALAGAQLFTTLDLASSYWQVKMDAADRKKTAFPTCHGLFEFQVMPFGLCNAPGMFQRHMKIFLADLQWQTCLVYLDDVIIFGQNFEEHHEQLKEVFQWVPPSRLQAETIKALPAEKKSPVPWPCHFRGRCKHQTCED